MTKICPLHTCARLGRCAFNCKDTPKRQRPMPKLIRDLEVHVGCMTENGGRKTWIVHLCRLGSEPLFCGYQIYSSPSEGRARYEAASLKHFLGQGPFPDILAFDTKLPDEGAVS